MQDRPTPARTVEVCALDQLSARLAQTAAMLTDHSLRQLRAPRRQPLPAADPVLGARFAAPTAGARR